MKRYLIFVWGDVEPSAVGPFRTDQQRDARARDLREEEGDEHGIYWVDVHPDGHLEVGAYSGAVFEKAE